MYSAHIYFKMYIFQITLEYCICYANLLYTKIDKNEWDYKYSNVLLRDFSNYIINTGSKLLSYTFIL